MSLISHYKSFKTEGNLSFSKSAYLYLHFLFYRIKYGIGIKDYFENKLFEKGEGQSQYWLNLHTYIHSWKNVIKNFANDKSKLWLFLHYFDYQFSKIYCPGADAMDYFRYEWYRIMPKSRKEFITEGYLPKMVKRLNGGKETDHLKDIFRNKAKFNNYFSEFISRKWFVNIDINVDEFVSKALIIKRVICKPINEGGGKGIFVKTIETNEDAENLYNKLKEQPYIIEEVIVQHEVLARICPNSVNTIRVFSVIDDNNVTVVSACLRIGNGVTHTDNYSSGGFVAEIDINYGIVISRAVNQNGLSAYVHPFSGVPIIGTSIPNWNVLIKTVVAAHKKVPKLGYIGWDVVVCSDGSITFIEGNTTSGVELQQHAPLKGKMSLYKPYINTIVH